MPPASSRGNAASVGSYSEVANVQAGYRKGLGIAVPVYSLGLTFASQAMSSTKS
jgi:hypothetical protein